MDNIKALFTAVEKGDLDTVENMISENNDLLEAVNSENLTPLAAALYCGQADMLQLIINLGAKLNVPGKDGQTALGWAREQDEKNEAAAALLLTDYMDRLYNTAVWWKKREERVAEGKEKIGNIDLDANCDSCGCILNFEESILLSLDEALSTEKYTDRLADQAVKILPPEKAKLNKKEIVELICKQIRENNLSTSYMVCESCRDKLFSETIFGKNRKFILESIEKLFKDQL